MSDVVVLALVVLSFAVLATAHVTITFGVGSRDGWRRALLAFFVFPLAPWLALRHRMRVRAVAWLAAAAVYLVARVLAAR